MQQQYNHITNASCTISHLPFCNVLIIYSIERTLQQTLQHTCREAKTLKVMRVWTTEQRSFDVQASSPVCASEAGLHAETAEQLVLMGGVCPTSTNCSFIPCRHTVSLHPIVHPCFPPRLVLLKRVIILLSLASSQTSRKHDDWPARHEMSGGSRRMCNLLRFRLDLSALQYGNSQY